MERNQDGLCGKTCQAPCPRRMGRTSAVSSKASSASKRPKQMFLCLAEEGGTQCRLAPRTQLYRRSVPSTLNSGMDDMESGCQPERSWVTITLSLGESSMRRRVGASHKDGNVYLLSSILMDNVPERFSLSPKACQGILRRAVKLGKELPEVLRLALERQANARE